MPRTLLAKKHVLFVPSIAGPPLNSLSASVSHQALAAEAGMAWIGETLLGSTQVGSVCVGCIEDPRSQLICTGTPVSLIESSWMPFSLPQHGYTIMGTVMVSLHYGYTVMDTMCLVLSRCH